MKRFLPFVVILTWFIFSCRSGEHPPKVTHIDLVKFSEGIKSLINKSIIDTRSECDYRNGHIKGALSVPIKEIRKGTTQCRNILSKIQKTELYLYCNGTGCDSSSEAAKYLQYCDFKAIYVFDGGWHQWSQLHADDMTGEYIERK